MSCVMLGNLHLVILAMSFKCTPLGKGCAILVNLSRITIGTRNESMRCLSDVSQIAGSRMKTDMKHEKKLLIRPGLLLNNLLYCISNNASCLLASTAIVFLTRTNAMDQPSQPWSEPLKELTVIMHVYARVCVPVKAILFDRKVSMVTVITNIFQALINKKQKTKKSACQHTKESIQFI